jgi:hypothetical protein
MGFWQTLQRIKGDTPAGTVPAIIPNAFFTIVIYGVFVQAGNMDHAYWFLVLDSARFSGLIPPCTHNIFVHSREARYARHGRAACSRN